MKGGDPAARSRTATLLRLSANHEIHRESNISRSFGRPPLSALDGRCVQGPGTYSRRRADAPLLAIPTSCSRISDYNPNWACFFEICSTSRLSVSL